MQIPIFTILACFLLANQSFGINKNNNNNGAYITFGNEAQIIHKININKYFKSTFFLLLIFSNEAILIITPAVIVES